MSKLIDAIYQQFDGLLDEMLAHPDETTEDDRSKLDKLYSRICKVLGISEHSQWRVEWRVEKWADTARKLAGLPPDEIACETQNIVLDVGATEMLNLIAGTGGTPFSAENSYIHVGTDTTAENAAQEGVLATGSNKASAPLDEGYPVVTGRQVVYRASFGDTEANFAWNEAAIVNGSGTNAVAMNRKVAELGTKATGTWTLQITLTLTSA